LSLKCEHIYAERCSALIAKNVENLESLIRQDLFPGCSSELIENVTKLKSSYFGLTENYPHALRSLVIAEITEKLLIKGFDAIVRRDKETSSS
jgi:hypothetical protein